MSRALEEEELLLAERASGDESAPPPSLWRMLPLPEIILAASFVLTGFLIGQFSGLPLNLPDAASLAFTGMSNQAAALIVISGILIVYFTQTAKRTLYFATALVAYGAILVTHFNVKLWIHAVNRTNWDQVLWNSDQAVRPLVDGALSIHRGLAAMVGPIDRLYLFAFIAMFVCSITIHCSRDFPVFRRVMLTAMLVHVLGGLSYLIAPSLGPFLFEPGVNALETKRQVYMLASHKAAAEGGIGWFQLHGSEFLATGLGAMPSLHVASSAVFLYYAWVYERMLGWAYIPLFLFIMIEAVATRWHYVLDVVAGLGLTAIAVVSVEYFLNRWLADGETPQPVR